MLIFESPRGADPLKKFQSTLDNKNFCRIIMRRGGKVSFDFW